MASSRVDRLQALLGRLGFILCPPLEVWWTNRLIINKLSRDSQEHYREVYTRYLEQFSQLPNLNVLASEVDRVAESEHHRREVIDSRASSFLSTLSIVIPLALLVPQVVTTALGVTPSLALALGTLIAVALVHFAAAVYHAVMASRIGPFFLPSASAVERLMDSANSALPQVAAAQKLTFVNLNEPRLTMKTNHLFGAQEMLRRGIVLLTVAAIGGISMYVVATFRSLAGGPAP